MQNVIPVSKGITWVGVNDRQTELFESLWPLPKGVAYNAYVIDDEKVALLDTVKDQSAGALRNKLRQVLGNERGIDYLIAHHLEPDHSGSIRLPRELYPQMEIVGTAKMAQFLEALYGITDNVRVVKDGDTLTLGQHTLHFVATPMVHWPETMMTYEASSKTLFSADAFGGFGTLDGDIFDETLDTAEREDETLRYFANIVGKYCPMVQKALGKLAGQDVAVVAPTHGPIWRKNPGRIIGLYDKWSQHVAEPGVVLAYASMYGNTERLAEAAAAGVRAGGGETLVMHDVSKVHRSFILRDIWRYGGLILGAPTYDTRLFPPMDDLVRLLAGKAIKNRQVGIFGNYGWSGGAVKALQEWAATLKLEVVEPVIEARFGPVEEDLDNAFAMGRQVAERVTQHCKNGPA